jgi:ubiquinone biosynthesis protein COQ4
MTSTSAASLTDTRRHPIAAYRAVRRLMQNREDTRQVFLLIDALRGKTTLRQLAKFRATEFGRKALADRRRLFDRLEDWDTLKALPAGTLGRAYYEFMASENLSAAGLAKISTIPQSEDEQIWFRERGREMHDLLHIVTGYGRDPLGEASLVAFSYAQTGQLGFAVISLFAARRISQARPGQPIRRTIFEGYRRGRRAKWLWGADWETLLSRPVEEIRQQYAVPPADCYPKVVATLRQDDLLTSPQPATATPA